MTYILVLANKEEKEQQCKHYPISLRVPAEKNVIRHFPSKWTPPIVLTTYVLSRIDILQALFPTDNKINDLPNTDPSFAVSTTWTSSTKTSTVTTIKQTNNRH